MGLFDTPLPPRPSPPEKDPAENTVNDMSSTNEEPTLRSSTQRLFFFRRKDGTEERNLLPQLSRSLESEIGCDYKVTDSIVQNLVSQTNCHPEDAAWALEACRGDITEASNRISIARRILRDEMEDRSERMDKAVLVLSNATTTSAQQELVDFRRKLQLQEQKRQRDDYFSGGKADAEWLPRPHPKPINDEPWFTG